MELWRLPLLVFQYRFIMGKPLVADPARIRTSRHENMSRRNEGRRAALGTVISETACLVALDLEAGEAIKILKKTGDFRVICVDHDETMKDSNDRLERVRKQYSPLTSGDL